MKLIIGRTFENDRQTIGQMHVVKDDNVIFTCATLELPFLNNERRVSCIPSGIYNVEKRVSKKFGEHFHILDVSNRSYILIHKGNYHTQILGCVLVGAYFKDINHDGYTDVVSSGHTVKKLLNILPEKFKLTIT